MIVQIYYISMRFAFYKHYFRVTDIIDITAFICLLVHFLNQDCFLQSRDAQTS